MNGGKAFWRSKTFWLGVGTAVIGFLEQLREIPDLPDGALTVVGLLIIVLRFLTTTPVRLGRD